MNRTNIYKIRIKNTNKTIDLSEPNIHIIIGHNTEGKTTLFNILSSPFFKTKFSGIRVDWEIELPFGKIKASSIGNKKILYLPNGMNLWKDDDIRAYLSEAYGLKSFGFLFNYPFITYSIPQFFGHMIYRNLDALLFVMRMINLQDTIDLELIEQSEDADARQKLQTIKRLVAIIMIKKAKHYIKDVVKSPILDVFDDLYNFLFARKIDEDVVKRNIITVLSKYVYELNVGFELSGKVFMQDILTWVDDLLDLLDKDLASSEKNILMTSIILSELELYAQKIVLSGHPYIPFIAFDEFVHHLDADKKSYIIQLILSRINDINKKYGQQGPKFGVVLTMPIADYEDMKNQLPNHNVIRASKYLGNFIIKTQTIK